MKYFRTSVLDSASPAPDEELPSLQSSTSSSSSDSPVPAKKDKECEARPPKETPKPRKASLPVGSSSSRVAASGFALSASSARSCQQSPAPIDYPSSLSPQVSPTLRRSVAMPYTSRLPSIRPLTRSTSVSPVRTVLPSKAPLTSSKSLSSTLSPHPQTSFKLGNGTQASTSGVPMATGRRLPPPSFLHHTPSGLPRRTPSSSLKRPQPASTPKQSKSGSTHHGDNTRSLTTTTSPASLPPKGQTTPRLLSPTVSSALKSCAVPLRAVNSLSRTDCELHGNAHHRRSLILTGTPPPLYSAQENKASPVNRRSSGTERATLKKPPMRNSISSSTMGTPTGGASVVRRSSLLLERSKAPGARKSMDLDGLRRKAFTDDMLVC